MDKVYEFAESHADEIVAAYEAGGYTGWCTSCGIEVSCGVDPDACGDPCESCGERAVYGTEELLLYAVA